MIFMPRLLDDAAWNIRRLWIYLNCLATRRNDKIQILHGNGTQQHFLAEDNRSDETRPICKRNFDWTDIIANVPLTISRRHFPLLNRLKSELQYHMLRQAKGHCASVNESSRFYRS
jgi:hypothetical protein